MTTPPRRILFVHNGSDLYGASRSLLRLASRLVRDGSAVLAVLPGDGPLRRALADASVPSVIDPNLVVVTRLGSKRALLLKLPRSLRSLRATMRSFRPDVVHTNSAVVVSSSLAARLERVPHVWHVRESFAEFPRLWAWYQRFMFFFATRIVCVSTAIAEQFAEEIRHRKVSVLHNGFPKDELVFPDARRIEKFKERFGLGGHLAIGVVGRIKLRRKGQEVLVRAAALLRDRFPIARFLVVGSPFPGNEEHLEKLMALVRELGLADRVVHTGDADDIHAAYGALDIVVLPSSLPEPFGGVVIEAMAFGKPVVGTRIGGTIEQVDDGVTGFLVPPDDPAALAAALERLLADASLRTRMGQRGRERFLEKFEFEGFYDRLTELYASLRPADARRT